MTKITSKITTLKLKTDQYGQEKGKYKSINMEAGLEL